MNNRTTRKLVCNVTLILFLCAALVSGQQGRISRAKHMSVDLNTSRLVNVSVVVTDQNGQVFDGLGAGDFQLFEDGEQRPIDNFTTTIENAPVLTLFSASRRPNNPLPDKIAMPEMIVGQQGGAEFGDWSIYSNGTAITWSKFEEMNPEWTLEIARRDLLFRIQSAVDWMKKSDSDKHYCFVVITDLGKDSAGPALRAIKRVKRDFDVDLYFVHIGTQLDESELKDIAALTGARTFSPENSADLTPISSEISRLAGQVYNFQYASSDKQFDGKWHKINVVLKPGEGRNDLTLSAREGFIAGKPPMADVEKK
jgi:hypothetical protein